MEDAYMEEQLVSDLGDEPCTRISTTSPTGFSPIPSYSPIVRQRLTSSLCTIVRASV